MLVDSAAIALCDGWNVVVVTPVVSEPSSVGRCSVDTSVANLSSVNVS